MRVRAPAVHSRPHLISSPLICALDEASAADALIVPAEALGATWQPDALRRVYESSHGYPYLVQTGGKYTWDYAATSPITAEDADAGLVQARREVDAGLYAILGLLATALPAVPRCCERA